jgi:hypothetical protein
VSGAEPIILGNVTLGPAPSAEDSMAESIVMLLTKLAEVEAERDFYKAAAETLRKNKSAAVTMGRTVNTGRSDLSRRTISETVAFLRKFNAWRRGDDSIPQPQPRKVGEMIDAACDQIERMEKEIEGLRDDLCGYKCADKAAADGGWGNI